MAIALFGLAFYLMAMAKWGKSLKAKNTELNRRRIYGLVGAAPMLLSPLVLGVGRLGGWGILFIWTWCVACAVLGYVTVAHAPQWLVGKPKPNTTMAGR